MEQVVCGRHGATPLAFACRHAAGGVACGFWLAPPDPAYGRPNATCDLCEERAQAGAELEAKDLVILCTHCWDDARARNESVPAFARGKLLAEDLGGTPAPKSDHPGGANIEETDLAGKVGQRILPIGVSIVDDPTLTHLGKLPLIAGYRFDEEGIATQRVALVENGTFKRFLMSRTPRKGFDHSNGHGFSSPFSSVRAHPSNLIVSANNALSDAALRARAISVAKEQGLPFVLVVERLDENIGDRDDFDPAMFMSPASLPRPAVMKRLYLDGHEELVRGGALTEVTLRSLRDILAVGSTPTAYHYLGSGVARRYEMMLEGATGYTVSVVAPALLFRDVDVKRSNGPQKAAPVVPRPRS